MEHVAQPDQVHRVLRGVIEHVGAERPHRPVGPLMLLVELEPERALQERREPERLDP